MAVVSPDRPVGGGQLVLCAFGLCVLWRPFRVPVHTALEHLFGSIRGPSWLMAEPK